VFSRFFFYTEIYFYAKLYPNCTTLNKMYVKTINMFESSNFEKK